MRRHAFAAGPGELEQVKALVRRRLGISLDDAFEPDRQILDHMSSLRVSSLEDYLDRLHAPEELRALADALTVKETYFFRGRAALDALVDVILPELAREKRGRISILSAACASGEEPYSIAMAIRDRQPQLVSRVHLEGADVSPSAIAQARRGYYRAWSLRDTPPDLRRRWFEERADGYVLDPSIVGMVRLSEQNLASSLAPVWSGAPWDIVLCRHMMMYFSREAARQLVADLERSIRPGGYLFLAPAETLRGLTREFELRQIGDSFHYRRCTTGEVSMPSVAPEPSPPVSFRKKIVPPPPPPARPRPPSSPAFDPEREISRAVILADSGDHTAAEEILLRVLGHDDLQPAVHYLLAVCRAEAGDLEAAIRHDEAAIFLEPGFAMPHVHLALLARRVGRLELARRELENAISAIAAEDEARLLRFGGGFDRAALLAVCRRELDGRGGR